VYLGEIALRTHPGPRKPHNHWSLARSDRANHQRTAELGYQALTQKALGLNGTHGLIFLGACYLFTAAIYVGTKIYRKRKDDLDLSLVYQELPVE